MQEDRVRMFFLEELKGSDKYGKELCTMMDYYGVMNLTSLTTEEIKDYYLHVFKKHESG